MLYRITFYRILCAITALLFIYLFTQLLFFTDSFAIGVGLQPCETALILGRRTSIFMLGIAILMVCSVNLPHSKARQYICLSTGITMMGLACMGSYELIRGSVNLSMLQAIIIEIIIGTSFIAVTITNRNTNVI